MKNSYGKLTNAANVKKHVDVAEWNLAMTVGRKEMTVRFSNIHQRVFGIGTTLGLL